MNLDTRDHGYWRNVARILGIGLIGWTYRERATFSDGLLLNQNAADVLIKQYAEIERLKEEIWRLRWPTITTNDATAHLWIEKDAEIERLKKVLGQAIGLANIRLEYRAEHGDPEGDTHRYVCCDSCGTPFLNALADELERRAK